MHSPMMCGRKGTYFHLRLWYFLPLHLLLPLIPHPLLNRSQELDTFCILVMILMYHGNLILASNCYWEHLLISYAIHDWVHLMSKPYMSDLKIKTLNKFQSSKTPKLFAILYNYSCKFWSALLFKKSIFCQKVTVHKDRKSPSKAIWKSLHVLLNETC